MRKLLVLLCAMLFVSGLSGIAEASFIIYDQETAFTSAASTAGVSLSFESFEDLTAINTESLDTVTVDDFTITGPTSSLGVFNTDSGGAYATEGNQYVKAFTTSGSAYTFTFNSPITAVGLHITDITLEISNFDWDFIDSNSNTFDFSDTYTSASNRVMGIENNDREFDIFLGIIYSGEAINSFTISATPDGNGLGFDSVYLESAPIPEPTTMLLLGSGLVGLAGFRRKSKK